MRCFDCSRANQMPSAFDDKLSGIRRYLLEQAVGDTDEAFTNRTNYGLLVGVGDSKFMLSPYREGPDRPVEGMAISGLYSFDELAELEIPKPEPVVEDLIHTGETILLAGRPKVGKSRLVHQLALAIEGGHSFLGMNVPKPRRVLIVDLENRRWAVKDRLGRMSSGAKVPGLFVWCTDSLSADEVNSTDGVTKLRGYIERSGAEVVIIDPWRLWLGKDENNAEEVVRGLRALSSLRQSCPDLTIIIVHHVRKEKFDSPRNLLADPRLWADSVSGHHALSSHVDACYGLERQRDEEGEECIIFGGIARNTLPRTILLEDDESTLRFEVCQREAALRAVLTKAEGKIWDVAAKLRNFAFNKLVDEAHTKNKKAVVSTLQKAKSHGLLTQAGTRYEVVGDNG